MEYTADADYLNYLETFITTQRRDKFIQILKQRTKHFTVAIEDVFQMHNTSAVMRTCDVFGIQELNVIEELYGKKIDKEIAMGAQKWVDIHRHDSVTGCIKDLKSKGYRIIATTPHTDSCYLDDFDISTPAALFFGTERLGLSQEVMEQADGFLKIPMYGFTESLNISVSAAIIVQNIIGRLHKSEIEWQLTENEILEKRTDWARKSIKDIDFITQKYIEKIV